MDNHHAYTALRFTLIETGSAPAPEEVGGLWRFFAIKAALPIESTDTDGTSEPRITLCENDCRLLGVHPAFGRLSVTVEAAAEAS